MPQAIRSIGVLLSCFSFLLFAKSTETSRAIKFKTNAPSISAIVDAPLNLDLKTLLSDQGSGNLRWSATQLPAWLKLNVDRLQGTPRSSDIGSKSFRLTVQDLSADAGAIALPSVVVRGPIVPPTWKQKPLSLSDATEGIVFSYNLKPQVNNPEGQPLVFALKTTSPWLSLSSDGVLSGTPSAANVGANSIELWVRSVIDGQTYADANTIKINVLGKPNQAPYWLTKPTFLKDAQEDYDYVVKLTDFAKDNDGDKLSFEKLSGSEWVKIAEGGYFSGRPGAVDVGETRVKVRVTDSVSGSDEAEMVVKVIHTNHAPLWSANPIDLGTTKEKQPFAKGLAPFASDVDSGDTLTFAKISGPAWATVSTGGEITGTPGRAHIGINDIQVSVSDGVATTPTVARVTVEYVNNVPVWKITSLNLPDVFEDGNLEYDLAPFVSDEDGDQLSFKMVAGPAWINASVTGKLSGTPKKADVGNVSATFEVTDGMDTATNTATGKVIAVNHPPQIPAGGIHVTVKEREQLIRELTKEITDVDGDTLKFTLHTALPFGSLSPEGKLSLSPLHEHIGKVDLAFDVSDGTLPVSGQIHVTVIRDAKPPIWKENPIAVTMQALKPLEFSIADKAYDIDGMPLTFGLVRREPGVEISPEGKVRVSAGNHDVGSHSLLVYARNDARQSVAKLILNIEASPAPVWLENPIHLSAYVGKPLSFSLGTKVHDENNLPIRFKKFSGPNWLRVSEQGLIEGTALTQNLGENHVLVTASNEANSAVGTVYVHVSKVPDVADVHDVTTPVEGAEVENIWVVDDSRKGAIAVAKALSEAAPVFFNTLSQAKVRSRAVVLSTDVKKTNGIPIAGKSGKFVLDSADVAAIKDFRERLAKIIVGSKENSPLWSLLKFQNVSMTEDFPKNSMPIDGFIATRDPDFADKHSAGTNYELWKPKNYAEEYLDHFAAKKKLIRVSAVGPECYQRAHFFTDAYRVVAEKTQGKYFKADCYVNLNNAMKEYADYVVTRAYSTAKKRFTLTKTPEDASMIIVKLGGRTLAGNTGAVTDSWFYEAGTNEVVLRWDLIDLVVKPGDKLEISYSGLKNQVL